MKTDFRGYHKTESEIAEKNKSLYDTTSYIIFDVR